MLLSQLEYFRVVARHEHVSHAAEELRVAQPALSATIRRLEKELGVPLFDRQGRNIELNYAGRRLLQHTEYVFNQLQQMQEALLNTKERMENRFTLSVSNSMFLSGWLQQFVVNNPKIQLRQRVLSEKQMIESLEDESIDVALGEFDADIPGIERRTIVEDEYVIIIPEKHPLATKEFVYFEDIRNEGIVRLQSGAMVKIADIIFQKKDSTPNIIFEGNRSMASQVMGQGNGLMFASKQMIYMGYRYYPMEAEQSGVARTIVDIEGRCNLALCWKKNRTLPMMAEKFITELTETYPDYHRDEAYLRELEFSVPKYNR